MLRTKYICTGYTIYLYIIGAIDRERENKRQDVIGLMFELRVMFIEAIDKSILARGSS